MPAVTNTKPDLSQLDADVLRELLAHSRREVAAMKRLNEKLTHEMAVLKRLRFAARSELYSPEQRSLLDEAIDATPPRSSMRATRRKASLRRAKSDRPNASRCRHICHAAKFVTNPPTRTAAAAAR